MDALIKVLQKHSIKLILPFAFLGLVYWIWVVPPKYQGYQPDQPVPFSHKIHAGEMQMDCQFCHVAVERGAHATVPDSSTCMKCHEYVAPDSPNIQFLRTAYERGEPIRWNKVHDLPDHVRFNHKAHIVHGLGKDTTAETCAVCHGDMREVSGKVEVQSAFNMGWCVNCHRDWSDGAEGVPGVQPGLEGDIMNAGDNLTVHLTECSTCHY